MSDSRVTDHADTIRLREVSEALLEAWRTTDPEEGPPVAYYEFRDAVQPEAVLALLAERQQAIDALRQLEDWPESQWDEIAMFVRAALMKLGEKP